VVKATNPLLIPLRKIVPSIGRHDIASLVLALILTALMVLVIAAINGRPMTGQALFGATLYFGFKMLIDLFFWTVLIRALLSWFAQGRTAASSFLEDLTDPVLKPVQRPAILIDHGLLE